MAIPGSRTHGIMVEVLKEQVRYEEKNPVLSLAFGYMRTMTQAQKDILADSEERNRPFNEARRRWATDRLTHYVQTGVLA